MWRSVIAYMVLALAAPATQAGNVSKTFSNVSTPAPPRNVTPTFNDARGTRFIYDYPAPKPSLGPSGSNGTPSQAIPLDQPFVSVGTITNK